MALLDSFRNWSGQGERLDEQSAHAHQHPWYLVIWLTGVDYFSTLGYQPGIALLAAGALSPFATAVLVLVTLTCALPIYAQVARRSFAGQGSIAMLENLAPGWIGKLFVLVLLGFAGTDFVITMTLSAADAAQHAIENPLLHPYLGDARMGITIGLLALLTAIFLRGFKEAIGFAAAVCVPYLVLNAIVLVRCLMTVVENPQLLSHWKGSLARHGDWTGLLIASVLIFPRLALGLSGFETGVSVMPLIAGLPDDKPERPLGRIHNTRLLLVTAAVIMSVMLLVSSYTTTLLIPERAYRPGGPANGRAIAYLAHLLMGNAVGTAYDVSTILILWFAGASAMAGLLNLIPRYLPRFGMAPLWVAYSRPLVLTLFLIDVIVTVVFKADVDKQGGAYATGVLFLMFSASVASALSSRQEHGGKLSIAAIFSWLVAVIFGYTLVDNVIERPDGVIIASIFIVSIVAVSIFSRYMRSTELRVAGLELVDDESKALWKQITGKKVHLVPLSNREKGRTERKVATIHKNYNVKGPMAFIHVNLLDNRSDFLAPLKVKVSKCDCDYNIEVYQAVAIANTIAYISEELQPISIFLDLTRRNPMQQAVRFFLFGEGETGLLVYTVLLRHWEETPEEDVRPCIYLMSH